LVCVPAAGEAADTTQLEARGKAILQEKCGRCHAVEGDRESPLTAAPPMRDIYVRFAPRELEQELLQGMVSKHKAMPQIEFSHEDVAAIMAYLYALAARK
jgi:mono/diheme cytochrome c family protein